MPPRWTTASVESLAPDSASVTAGRKLTAPGVWSGDGCTGSAVWGLAKGSGKQPYQAAIDLGGPAYLCSCPSRKIPCKHVLGLLLRWADGTVAEAEPPAFVSEWLNARSERAVASESRAQQRAAAQTDPQARAKRQARRAAAIDAGLNDLQRVLTDLVRHGLATGRERPAAVWDEQARRLVDAQAPALAGGLRELGRSLHAGHDRWPTTALQRAGLLHLVASAWLRGDAVPGDLRDDLRAHLGWSRSADEVRASSPVLDGPWAVLGINAVDDDRLRTRRTWLLRPADGRLGLLLDFAAGGAPLGPSLVIGTLVDGPLHAFPGRSGLRLQPGAGELQTIGRWEGPPAGASIAAALDAWGAAVARDPLVERIAVPLSGATLVPVDGDWWVRDAAGDALRSGGATPWDLIAVAGGRPLDLTAEWDGHALTVLAAHDGVELWPVGGRAEANAA